MPGAGGLLCKILTCPHPVKRFFRDAYLNVFCGQGVQVTVHHEGGGSDLPPLVVPNFFAVREGLDVLKTLVHSCIIACATPMTLAVVATAVAVAPAATSGPESGQCGLLS